MKKTIRIIYVVLFLAICIAPVALMPFFGSDTSAENRELSEMSSFINEDGTMNLEWPSEFETYLSEHFAFRQNLVTLDSIIKAYVFRTSANDSVIVGQNGWLYYASTADDYLSRNTLSERRINNTAKTLELIQVYVEQNGGEFLFMAAPNKNTVYPQNMPARYVKSNNPSNLELLTAELDACDVNQLLLSEVFRSQDKVLYHSRDSHWTNEGAILVYNVLMEKLGIDHYTFSECPHHTENIWNGDLDTMLFPSNPTLCGQEIYDIDYTFNYAGTFNGSDDLTIKTINEDKTARMLMYRDSFGRSLYPFVAENCYKAEFSRQTPYNLNMMNDIEAGYVVLEIVERNIPTITDSAPIMAAPVRAMNISASLEPSEENSCFTEDSYGMLNVYGKLDEKYFDNESDIYITLEGESGVYCFEAFPIYEAELMNDDFQSDFGYSLYIDTTSIPNGSYNINAYVKNGENYICTDSLKKIDLSK